MSLIHLEKSVLTFHFKEILESGDNSHPLTWLGLGVLLFGSPLLPLLSQPRRDQPIQSGRRVQGEIPLSEWIAQAQQRSQLTTNLSEANLSEANLSDTNLSPTDSSTPLRQMSRISGS
ncbi:MAG: pentapeptide repeat-containing protein [Sodalinema sp.]|uniref:pentapeptide repeat-containing protein n=1 Tax=Sodalinema sp. TaxID=3080550 RepID=UPI0012057098|nr:MAG: hypothetical protein EYR95_05240 [Phormidium sp. SL48-SHIP]